MTRSADIANRVRKALTAGTLTADGELSGAGGVTVYATIGDLPLSGVSAGAQAYITATNRLYVHNGTGWYAINIGDAYSAFPTVMEFYLWGEGGTATSSFSGGGGGFTYGEISDPANSIGTTYTIKVNSGAGSGDGVGGNGGGYVGVFTSATITQANAALIAAGGGGAGTYTNSNAGAGGGLTGQSATFAFDAGAGYGATQSAGGGWADTALNNPGGSGSALTGFSQNTSNGPGNTRGAGGGGGGYYGGGGGGKYYGGGGGGGGSGYVDSAEFVNSYTQTGDRATPANSESSLRNGYGSGAGAGNSPARTHGVAIIRYEAGSAVATGGTITTDGSYIVHTFDSDGSFYITG